MKHTPGPWKIVRQWDFDGPSKTTFVERIGPFHIEWHDDLNKSNDERIEADIALMAAAPDLLKALNRLQANPNDPRAHRQALNALKKAGAA